MILDRINNWFQSRKSVHSNNLFAGFRYKKTWLLMVDKNNPDNILKRLEIPATTKITATSSNKVVTYDAESYSVLAGGVVAQPVTLTISSTILKTQIADLEEFAKPGVLIYVFHSMPIGGLISSEIERQLKGKKFQITGLGYSSVGYVQSVEVEIEAVEINIFSTPKRESFVKKKGSSSGTKPVLPAKKEELYKGDYVTDKMKPK